MHMADALVSPAVGGTLWAVTGGMMVYCARKVKDSLRDNLVPLMGVLGAFIFAAQMINFSIPGTGSSGHLGGGLILTVLLGPYAAFLVIASVLTVQALFFADGGLLTLGCNIFNLGFFPAFVAYPLIYRTIAGDQHGTTRAWVAAIIAAISGLLLGAFSVVLETMASGISELPFRTFLVMMLPIHLAIGSVEGLATAAVISFVAKARPEALYSAQSDVHPDGLRPVLIGLAVAAAVLGGVAGWFASTHPDGLEWSIAKVSGNAEVSGAGAGVHKGLAGLQEKTAFLPGYGFKAVEPEAAQAEGAAAKTESWPAVSTETSVAGIAGGLLTLALACLVGVALRAGARRSAGGKS